MTEQTIIQIRVDNELKNMAAEVFEEIGIDIPTAVRMFFKASVREGGLPFRPVVGSDKAGMQKTDEKNAANELPNNIKTKIMCGVPDASDDNTIVLLPLTITGEVSPQMYIQLLMKVPEKNITRWEDIRDFLGKLYGIKLYSDPQSGFPSVDMRGNEIPYWKVVSLNGVLVDDMRCSREYQKTMLERAGFNVTQRGKMKGSYKVENYKEYLFDYNILKVLSASSVQER